MESSSYFVYWCGFDGWGIGWELGTFSLLFSPLPSFLSPTFSSLSLTSRFQSWWKYWTHELTLQTVLILKYIIPDYTGYLYYGGANVAMNGGIMISYVPFLLSSPSLCILLVLQYPFVLLHLLPNLLSFMLHAELATVCIASNVLIDRAMILWVSQSGGDEYEYQLTV
jgi:hypothetical protein